MNFGIFQIVLYYVSIQSKNINLTWNDIPYEKSF
jgi:hypothetical protein